MSRHPCWRPGPGPCQSFQAGHNMHWIHARKVGESPWGWRDGVVAERRGDRLVVAYLAEEHQVLLWHHARLPGTSPGSPVRVHEGYRALAGPFGWVHVDVSAGLGAVPEPGDPRLYAAETQVPVVDLATGRALPVDGSATDEEPADD